jgi:hypothetical protein
LRIESLLHLTRMGMTNFYLTKISEGTHKQTTNLVGNSIKSINYSLAPPTPTPITQSHQHAYRHTNPSHIHTQTSTSKVRFYTNNTQQQQTVNQSIPPPPPPPPPSHTTIHTMQCEITNDEFLLLP